MAQTYKVLVTDDNEINAMLAGELLRAFGVDSDIAYSGQEAIDLASNNDYSFILMDHIMPEMDGAEAAAAILKIKQDSRIYAMTAELTEAVASEFTTAGAVGAIPKPLDPEALFEIIRANLPEGAYHSALSTESEDGEVSLKACLEDVRELDFLKGLTNSLGNEKSYYKILKASSGNIRQYVETIQEYLMDYNPSRLKLASHSLKSVFANLGVESLRELSEKYEQEANDLLLLERAEGAIRGKKFEEEINGYIAGLQDFADRLEASLRSYEEAHSSDRGSSEFYEHPETPLSDDEIQETLEYTSQALIRYEIDYLLEGLDILKKAATGDERKNLEAAIEATGDFNYEKVKEILDSLKMGRGEAR